MCRRRRYPLVYLFLLFAVSAAGAETVAVSVRLSSGPTDEPGVAALLVSMEEGVMDTMFVEGNIVFDIDVEGVSESTRREAIDLARDGGAAFLVLVDASVVLVPGRGLVPGVTNVMVVSVQSERDRSAESVDPDSFEGSDDFLPDILALEVGKMASAHALRVIGEVDSAW